VFDVYHQEHGKRRQWYAYAEFNPSAGEDSGFTLDRNDDRDGDYSLTLISLAGFRNYQKSLLRGQGSVAEQSAHAAMAIDEYSDDKHDMAHAIAAGPGDGELLAGCAQGSITVRIRVAADFGRSGPGGEFDRAGIFDVRSGLRKEHGSTAYSEW